MEIILLAIVVIIILSGCGYLGYTQYYQPRDRPNQVVPPQPPVVSSEFVVERPVAASDVVRDQQSQATYNQHIQNQAYDRNIRTGDGQVYGVNPNQSQTAQTTKVTPIVPGDGGRRGFLARRIIPSPTFQAARW
jgi:hypothetical protein